MPIGETSTMFCNCRFRKPLTLLFIISTITLINYSLINWLLGDRPNDAANMASVQIIPTEKECPLFEKQPLVQEVTEATNIIRSRTVQRKSIPRDNTFFDPQVLKEMASDDFDVAPGDMDQPQLNLEFNMPSNFEGPAANRRNLARMNSRPNKPRSEERLDSFIPTIRDDIEGMPETWNQMREMSNAEKNNRRALNNGFAWQKSDPKKAAEKTGPEPIFFKAPDLSDFEDDFISTDFDDPKAKLYRWNVTGKIEVDLPDRAFTGVTFEPGQALVKKMTKHAWSGYKKFAWGKDDLKPWSQSSKNSLGNSPLSLTIIDSLDTLHLMGMKEEFDEGAEFFFKNVSFETFNAVSLFETNIRVMGGLLSNYALTQDKRFMKMAIELGNKFMRNFDEGIFPSNRLQLSDEIEQKHGYYQMSFRSLSLAQIGTFSLEFGYLSHISGNPIYKEKALAIISELEKMETKIPGLYPKLVVPNADLQSFEDFSLSGDIDSFYEYLLKYWLLTGKKDKTHHSMYKKAVDGITKNLITEVDGKKYIISLAYGEKIMQLEHLACFAPGMLGLGAVNEGDNELLKLAEDLTETCYLSYHNQEHGIGCEVQTVPGLKPVRNGDEWYLRPEVIESIFYMWRFTKNPKYRKWAYEIAQNIEAACRVPTGGYSGIKGVNMTPVMHNDHQESFFLAETLKYLWLIFSSDEVIPLDKWVFNTEAHPLPVINDS